MKRGVDIVLTAENIAKRYGQTYALRDASLRLRAGCVHALLGENGAGKSTLVKIVVGASQADGGVLTLDGKQIVFTSVQAAIAAGIIPIYQHLSLFPRLSVIENLSAFAMGSAGRIASRSAMISRATAKDWLREVNLDVPLDMPVEKLSLGECQLLEIARGLGQSCKILVLDEPTAALSHDEAERLFTVVRRLCAAGTAVLFISHKFEEIEAIADDVTVLRDGRTVIDGVPLADVTRDQLVQAMLGVSVEATRRALPQPGSVLIRSEGLRLDRRGAPIDLAIRSGEIVGLAGLVGSGALEIASAVAAALPATGRLTIGEERIEGGDRRRAASLGIGYVPGDRHADGLFPVLPAVQNASAGSLEVFTAAGMISRRREAQGLTPWLRRLKLHPFDIDRSASGFSGGNQQKLIIARNLALPGLRALVLLEPTRGVDIAARETIHDAVVDAAKRGIAVLLASTDLDEILALSHRILVVRDRSIRGELPRETARSAVISALAGMIAA